MVAQQSVLTWQNFLVHCKPYNMEIYWRQKFDLNILPRKEFRRKMFAVFDDILTWFVASTATGAAVFNRPCTQWDSGCTADGDVTRSVLVHRKYSHIKGSRWKRSWDDCLNSDPLPYGNGPTCSTHHLIFVCTKNFDRLECEEYSVSCCNVVLMYHAVWKYSVHSIDISN